MILIEKSLARNKKVETSYITESTEVWSFHGASLTTFSISRALALMASNRRVLRSGSSGVGFGSMLAAATSSDSATDAGVFSWQVKG